eukprot:5177982-Pyramimonas_sp.AAC.1
MRVSPQSSCSAVGARLITGELLLRLIGFFGAGPAEDGLARLLVGNAYSGFAFAAVALAAFSGVGRGRHPCIGDSA